MALPLRDRLVQLEHTLERLFGGRPAREPLEVRRAVLDAILAQVQPVASGRRILPFNRVTVSIVAADAAERRLFKSALTGDTGLDADLRKGLEKQGAPWPADFALAVRFVKEPGKGWAAGARFHVAVATDEPTARPASPGTALARTAEGASTSAVADVPAIVLRVTGGQAKPKQVSSQGGRLSVGRQAAVTDQQGRVVRRNDLAFTGEDPASRSVSRAHGYVAWTAASKSYRVYDEHSSHGTQVARQGRLIPVPPGRDGLKLQTGDEIHLGQAVVRVEIAPV
jgi:hypothetical protein